MGLVFKNFFLAIPFYFLWNALAPIYLVNAPDVYKFLPFWHIVGIFLIIALLRLALFPKKDSPVQFKWKNFNFARPQNGFQSYSEDSLKDVTPPKQ